MEIYPVPLIAKMLSVNQETVRRWIRDDKLCAKRGIGREGHVILLQDIVDFANQPPRKYLLALEVWLDKKGIRYVRIEDGESVAIAKKVYNPTAAAFANTIVRYGILPGVIAATATYAKVSKRKSYPSYCIRLLEDDEEVLKDDDKDAMREAMEKDVFADVLRKPSSGREESFIKEETVDGFFTPEEAAPEPEKTRNFLDEIAQAKQLMDMGVLTPEEFGEIKARLIAKI